MRHAGQPLPLLRHHLSRQLRFRQVEGLRRAGGGLALPREGAEDATLLGQQLDDPLVHPLVGEKSVHLDALHLPHPVGPRDGLVLKRGFELRLADHHYRGSLDVQANAAHLDLGDQDRTTHGFRELIDDGLPLLGPNCPGEWAHHPAGNVRFDQVEHAVEVGVDDDLASVAFGFFDDRQQPFHLRRLLSALHGCLPHRHEVTRLHRTPIGRLISFAERNPLLDIDPGRQFGEDVLLVASQVRGCHRPAKTSRRQVLSLCGQVGTDIAHQLAELIDTVLQRGARHQQRQPRRLQQLGGALGPFGARVLDGMGLVRNQAVQRHVAVLRKVPTEAFVGGDGYPAPAEPLASSPFPVIAMQPVCCQICLAGDLPHPVRDHRRRAEHQEVRLAHTAKVRQHREGLNRLPQAHLVADDHLALDEDEARGKRLVATQRHPQVVGLQFLCAHRINDVLRKVTPGLLGVVLGEPQLSQPGEVLRRVGREVLPQVAGRFAPLLVPNGVAGQPLDLGLECLRIRPRRGGDRQFGRLPGQHLREGTQLLDEGPVLVQGAEL